MKLTDEIKIDAPRDIVYAALNDTDILRRAIPGCQELERVSENELTATVQAKVGPVKAKFKGNVTLSDLNPPESYTISGQGKGGAAGFAKGSAKVTLSEDGGGTILRYDVEADVGGKLAQVGSRLIEGTSKKLAGEFFETFKTLVTEGDKMPEAAESEIPPAPGPAVPVAWIIAGLVVVAALVLMWGF